MHLLSPSEAQELWPLMTVDDVIGAAFLPTDGQANPTDITMALAKGARQAGATICEDTDVLSIEVVDGVIKAVVTSHGRIECSVVVCCAGQWTRTLAATVGVNVPLVSVQHQYVITDAVRSAGAAGPADASRSRSVDLLQRGGRRVGDGRLRAQPDPVGQRRNPRATSTSSCSNPTSTTSLRRWNWRWAECRHCRPPASTS